MWRQSRWKSRVLWVSLASFVAFLLKHFYDIEIPRFDFYVDVLLNLLTGFGIINSPGIKGKL